MSNEQTQTKGNPMNNERTNQEETQAQFLARCAKAEQERLAVITLKRRHKESSAFLAKAYAKFEMEDRTVAANKKNQ
jgi:hypothetical protein